VILLNFSFYIYPVNQLETYEGVFAKYVTPTFARIPAELLLNSNVKFKVVKARKGKLGDFMPINKDGKPQITVNGNLNPFAFLITTLHEFAHYQTFLKFGMKVAPHGIQWKNEFKQLILPLLYHEGLPSDIQAALKKSIVALKASSCTDLHLSRVLSRYDNPDNVLLHLEKLPETCTFALEKRIFRKGVKRRTRYECLELSTQKTYLIHALALVKKLDDYG